MQNKYLGITPPMGWNSWNTFTHAINEELIKETADAMVASGLKEPPPAGTERRAGG